MGADVVALAQCKSTVADDLRTLAALIESGELKASTAVVVVHYREDEKVGRHICGDNVPYHSVMGLLAYAQHMLYGEIN